MRCTWLTPFLVALSFSVASTADAPLRAYRAARIIVAPGQTLPSATLLVRAGRVDGVLASGEKLPDGAELIDLGNVVIAPALVNPISSISERSYREQGQAAGVASSSARDPRDARGALARTALRPEETVWRRLGRSGYGAWGWIPDATGFLAGQGVVVRPRLGKEKDANALILKDPAFLLMSHELGKRWREVAEAELKKAVDAIAKEAEAKKAPPAPPPATPPPAPSPPRPPDPLVRAIKGEVPLFVRLRGPAAVDHFFRIYDKLSTRPRIVLITAGLPTEAIARLERRRDSIVAVILEPRLESGSETSVLSSAVRSFLEKGFVVALTPLADTLAGHEDMLLCLAEIAKAGVSEADVLAAVTTVPAELLGLTGKVGVLSKGAFASFNVYQGEPFSGVAKQLQTFIEGKQVFADDPATLKISGEAVK